MCNNPGLGLNTDCARTYRASDLLVLGVWTETLIYTTNCTNCTYTFVFVYCVANLTWVL